MTNRLQETLSALVSRINTDELSKSQVIPWSCPVPSFGDLSRARIATLGLNPSNREFVDEDGNELDGECRRFHTLSSLGLTHWSEARASHLRQILESCYAYFSRNPYDSWFKKLDYLMSGTESSYYDQERSACHLDLIPYATACKWTGLSRLEKCRLMEVSGDALALLLRDASISVLILNGRSVVEQFQDIAGIEFEKKVMPEWSLPRQGDGDVVGYAYKGIVTSISNVPLRRKICVLGFNHNIQSSFGVTRQVTSAIRNWVTERVGEANV